MSIVDVELEISGITSTNRRDPRRDARADEPVVASAGARALSSAFVVTNSLRLRQFRADPAKTAIRRSDQTPSRQLA